MTITVQVDFPKPPRVTGDARRDLPALVEYLWHFYRSAILSGGLIQNSQLAEQLEAQFLTLYNLGILENTDADTFPYFTAESEWALTSLTETARSLLAKDSVAAILTFLGVTTYTDEQVQDAVATMLQNGTGISWNYDDGANQLTANLADTAVTPGSYSHASITVDQQGRITAAADGSPWWLQKNSVGVGETLTIPTGYVAMFANPFTNSGTIINDGTRLVI